MAENFLLILKAIALGIIEGVTEFLPVSSTGHLILVEKFLNFEKDFSNLFTVVIQLGAILAIVVLYWDKIVESFETINDPSFKSFGSRLWRNLIVAFIPFGIVAFLIHDKVEEKLMYPLPVAFSLLVGGIFMIMAENKFRKNNKTKNIADVSLKQAFIIGCFQCMSVIWPGFSRSASTIIGGWVVGLSTVAAAEFSFFLAIPTMFIATFYSLLSNLTDITIMGFLVILIGFVVSFIVALIVVDKFMNFLKRRKMRIFAVYRILLSIIIIVFYLLKIV